MTKWKPLREFARAVPLAMLLFGITSTPSQADSIELDFSAENPVNDFIFGPEANPFYTFRIGFDQVLLPFTLTVTDNLVSNSTMTNPLPDDSFWEGFKCAEIRAGDAGCVEFTVTSSVDNESGLPLLGEHYLHTTGTGAINVGVSYVIAGWPLPGNDPVDLGETDNFSIFMVVANSLLPVTETPPFTFRLAHFGTIEPGWEDITVANCPGLTDISSCAELKGFSFTAVPEPATMLLLAPGLLGLAGFRRRQRRA